MIAASNPDGRIVHDVVQHVQPGTMASYAPGSWLVAHFAAEDDALAFAARCNACRLVDGIIYEVESHGELSPARRQFEADWKRDQKSSAGT